ncbi:hypothetical protein pb186bvf_004885 [Paramecium bursaria]
MPVLSQNYKFFPNRENISHIGFEQRLLIIQNLQPDPQIKFLFDYGRIIKKISILMENKIQYNKI